MYRKTISSSARSIHNQKNKKIEVDTFLYKTSKGIIDTTMLVAPISMAGLSQNESSGVVGTVELRLYVTRQLDVFHKIQDVQSFDSPASQIEPISQHTMGNKKVRPTFHMVFEKNCAPLDTARLAREQRKIKAPRPGTEPWAIFCFHYRSKGECLGSKK